MEVKSGKNDLVNITQFNEGISTQFVPYWNGLLHVVGNIENGVILRRYDWDGIIADCESFEATYLNTSGFCEQCPFSQIPNFLEGVMATAASNNITDCKQIAQDNDIIYLYCMKKYRARSFKIIVILSIVISLCLLAIFLYFRYGRLKTVNKLEVAGSRVIKSPMIRPGGSS